MRPKLSALSAAISEGERKNLEVDLRRLASTHDRIHDIHNIRVRRNSEGLFVHYHCRFAPDETVDMVHDVIDRIETALQQRHKEIRRVIAHAEPLGHLGQRQDVAWRRSTHRA